MDIQEGAAVVVSSITSRSFKREILEIIKDNNPSLSTIESEGKCEFYICDLINKALVIDTKTVGITVGDMAKEGLTILYITDFGKEFLKFIEVR